MVLKYYGKLNGDETHNITVSWIERVANKSTVKLLGMTIDNMIN